MFFILIVLIVALLIAWALTSASIAYRNHLLDTGYREGFDSGWYWGQHAVHIRSYEDLWK